MTVAKEAVREYWETYVRAVEVPGCPWASAEYFQEIKVEHDRMYGGANRILGVESLPACDLLELACGVGFDTVEFAATAARVTAIDFSPLCVDLTRKFLGYRDLEAHVELGDAEQLDYPDESFDVVVARGLLMFTPDDERVVREMFRVLRPGGEANVLVHNRYSWYVALAALSGTHRVSEIGRPPIDRLYTAGGLRGLLREFSTVEISRDRFPLEARRSGLSAKLFNNVVVPLTRITPQPLIEPFGYYLIVRAIK